MSHSATAASVSWRRASAAQPGGPHAHRRATKFSVRIGDRRVRSRSPWHDGVNAMRRWHNLFPHGLAGRCSGIFWRPGLLLLCALAGGCGDRQGIVSGRVSYNGAVVPGGWVTFNPTDSRKNSVTVPLDSQGNYAATLPVGEVRICVDNRELDRADRGNEKPRLPPGIKLPEGVKISAEPPRQASPDGGAPAPGGAYLAIPAKYHDIDTSGLTYTVQ